MTDVKTEKAPKGKKGEGPVTVSYLDGENKVSKRVPATVSKIVVTPRGDESKAIQFDIATLPEGVRNQLVALAVGKRLDTFIRNSVEGTNADEVVTKANEAYSLLNSGKLYSREAGAGVAGAGRPFDYDLYVEVIKLTGEAKKRPASDTQLAAYRNKLETTAPKERREMLLKHQKDPVYNACLKKVQAQRAKDELKNASKDGAPDALEGLF